MHHRSTALDAAIRREIIGVLAEAEDLTLPAATALVAEDLSARRERRGDSPASVHTAAVLVFQVGTELADELADGTPAVGAGGKPVAA